MSIPNEPQIDTKLIADHGLSESEYQKILDIMGREPSYTELGVFSAMWNEHCSYKSSKKWLKTLPTTGECVIMGPGENAGVVDIGDGQAVVFKMESHNHPSYIEPYQGAATGVGGILRDVFTMGARPIAAMNALRFGEPSHKKTRHLVSGVVSGVGGYGNCFGVPTIGGEVEFNPRYNGNNLVNAFAAGIADTDMIFYSEAKGVGLPVVYLGAKTGRDGVGGATMASAEFGDDIEEKRPTVQVGDPFTEKRLMEATLELMQTGAVIAIQDMGAAGLTCSAVEMGAKGNLGIELNLDNVPVREENMTPYEMMLSESQERMLMVLHPEKEAEARAVFEKWELDFATVGITTNDLRFRILWQGTEVGNMPIKELGDEAPEYDRPWEQTKSPAPLDISSIKQSDIADSLLTLIASPNLCSRKWVYEQYDTLIGSNSITTPGSDAGVVRVNRNKKKALAFSSDVTPRYVEADPFEGGKQAVAECWRNITASGALPLAATDNLNFGNPEKPEIMGQLVGAIKGIGEACKALNFPIVSGNVSLYNETNGVGILPTPTIAGVGILADWEQTSNIAFKAADEVILLVGAPKTWGNHLGQSAYLSVIEDRIEGTAPHVDLAKEKQVGDFVRELILSGTTTAVHDCSDGGLAIALAEMAMAGNIGATIEQPPAGVSGSGALATNGDLKNKTTGVSGSGALATNGDLKNKTTGVSGSGALASNGDLKTKNKNTIVSFFGEDQGRYILTIKQSEYGKISSKASELNIDMQRIGTTSGTDLKLGEARTISVDELTKAFQGWFPEFMKAEV